ncbi:MAG: YciI family protein [bacterium]
MRWVAIFEDNEGLDSIRKAHASAHFEYLSANRDKIVIAGGLRPAPGEWYSGGLWVLEVDSKNEAVRLVEGDPYFLLGLRKSYRLLVWGKAPCYETVSL